MKEIFCRSSLCRAVWWLADPGGARRHRRGQLRSPQGRRQAEGQVRPVHVRPAAGLHRHRPQERRHDQPEPGRQRTRQVQGPERQQGDAHVGDDERHGLQVGERQETHDDLRFVGWQPRLRRARRDGIGHVDAARERRMAARVQRRARRPLRPGQPSAGVQGRREGRRGSCAQECGLAAAAAGNYFVNELDNGGFEVVWKGQNCFISYNARGQSMSISPGCNDKQIQRSNDVARDRAR